MKGEQTMEVIVIGGGAAGMMAALYAAYSGADVKLIEQRKSLGEKLSITGNGRCNITNLRLLNEPGSSYLVSDQDKKVVDDIFAKVGVNETLETFKKLGLITKDRDGLVYPKSDQAKAVNEALVCGLKHAGVEIILDCMVKDIVKENKFTVITTKGNFVSDRCICAFGSKARPKIGGSDKGYYILSKLGHSVNDIKPGLVQLVAANDRLKDLKGVRADASLTLLDDDKIIYKEDGELQFTEYGLSGVVSMDISNYLIKCKGDASIDIDLAAGIDKDELCKLIANSKNRDKGERVDKVISFILHEKIATKLCKLANIDPAMDVSQIAEEDINHLVDMIKKLNVPIKGTNGFDEAQISLGGIPVSEVKANMESIFIAGLYIVGETLDVHGGCGGYNLQWAFSTGQTAGSFANQ